jgi:Mrp family chromosome partitioning ATPase
MTDATVLVTRAFATPYDVVRQARNLLYSAGARVLGVALNDVDLRRENYAVLSYYGYGNGDGHGDLTKQESKSQTVMQGSPSH